MSYIDTRDLIEERSELQQQILEDFNDKFNQQLENYLEIDSFLENFEYETDDQSEFLEYWREETEQIGEIDDLESEINNGEFEFGTTLVPEDKFEEYTEQLLIDCGYISRDFPTWIEIDWEATADNVKQDYSEVEFRDVTYFYR